MMGLCNRHILGIGCQVQGRDVFSLNHLVGHFEMSEAAQDGPLVCPSKGFF